MSNMDHLFAIKAENFERLMALPGVNGVGIGKRTAKGEGTDELVIGVTVDVKRAGGDLPVEALVPETLEATYRGERISARTDVMAIGTPAIGDAEPADDVRATGFEVRKRPMQSGYSTGGDNHGGFGTIGCFAVIAGKGYMLSNVHVMQGKPLSPVWQQVLQPGRKHGGRPPRDAIGPISTYMPLAAGKVNFMDASFCAIANPADVDTNVPRIGTLKGYYKQLNVGWHLRKAGCASGVTDGHIIYWDWSGDVPYDGVKIRFEHQVVIRHLAFGNVAAISGDSGSLWVTDDNYAAALTFAGSEGIALATPITYILDTFKAGLWVKRGMESDADDLSTADGIDPEDAPYGAGPTAAIAEQLAAAEDSVIPTGGGHD